jgi:hypothetical protein
MFDSQRPLSRRTMLRFIGAAAGGALSAQALAVADNSAGGRVQRSATAVEGDALG